MSPEPTAAAMRLSGALRLIASVGSVERVPTRELAEVIDEGTGLRELVSACELTLIFHAGGPFDLAVWEMLTAKKYPPTTKGLCDFVRAALRVATHGNRLADDGR